MRHAVFLAPHGEFADPRLVVELAVVAEASGWDAIFLWDHMARPAGMRPEVSDAVVCLTGIASATSRLRLGPMVTPLARRRPQKVARETVALDLLSNGRLTLGVGLGVDTGGELDRFGEETDNRRRGALLDEALALLLELWSGEQVQHQGAHFTARDVVFRPAPLQRPRIPVWAAARGGGSPRTISRAAGLDGVFPVHTSRAELVNLVSEIERRRGTLADFDVAWTPDGPHDTAQLEELGVTWLVRTIPEGTTVTGALRDVAVGPAS